MNVTVGNHIRSSDVDQRIISSQIVHSHTLWIRNFSGILKIQNIVRTDQRNYIRHGKIVHIKTSHRRYIRLWNVGLQIKKSLEDIFKTSCN